MQNLILSLCVLSLSSFIINGPNATAAQKRADRLVVKSTKAPMKELVIAPRTKDAGKPGFKFVQKSKRLFLTFDPGAGKTAMKLDPKPPFAVQIEVPYGLDIAPTTVTLADWPARTNEMELKVSNAAKGQSYLLKGQSVFVACDSTRRCSKQKSSFEGIFSP